MDIEMKKDGNNSYVYNPPKNTTENYDGRFNNSVNKNVFSGKYNKIKEVSKERKIEPVYKKTNLQNLEKEIQYKKIDIWV